MELYYNPEQMEESEIKQTFVARQWLLDDILSLLKRQPKGAGVQHGVIIGPRGMGKTTMLLMLRFAVRDGELGKKWFPVRFPEESYAITDLADFWLATISHLAFEAADPGLVAKVDALKKEYRDADTLCDAAVATLKDWSKQKRRRILLLVDNLDMVLDQIHSAADNARLRQVLMNDGTFMLVGTATSFFKEARNYDQALYNFFRTWNLESLNSAQLDELLRQRAAVDKQPNFEERLAQNRARISVLHYFTGGNPRLILMLYRIIATSDFLEVRRGLEKLLDEVTPYYKAKIETLPPQQRKILDCVARVSGRTGEGLTPTVIAEETRLPINQISTQLKRLSDLGYVRAANLRTRNSYYSLSEPLYAIWHQMRFGRESRQRMEWLVEFLRNWYTNREMLDQTEQLAEKFRELMTAGMPDAALKTVEFRLLLSDAMDPAYRGGPIDRIVNDCLDAKNVSRIRGALAGTDITVLTDETIHRLRQQDLIAPDQERLALQRSRVETELKRASDHIHAKNWDQALVVVESLEAYCYALPKLRSLRGHLLQALDRNLEALECFDQCLRIEEDDTIAVRRALALIWLNRFQQATDACDALILKNPSNLDAHIIRAASLACTLRFDEAAVSLSQAALRKLGGAVELESHVAALRDASQNPLGKFSVLVITGATDAARAQWNELLAQFGGTATAALAVQLVAPKYAPFLRTLVPDAGPDSPFFCVSRALDYVLTGDRSIIEKLSAEVRPAVEEIVRRYESRKPAEAVPPPSKKPRKVGAAGR